jgi:hypothetical protein
LAEQVARMLDRRRLVARSLLLSAPTTSPASVRSSKGTRRSHGKRKPRSLHSKSPGQRRTGPARGRLGRS